MSTVSVPPPVAAGGPFARLFSDARVHVAEMDPRLVPLEGVLLPEEAAVVAKAVTSRQQQFAAGRLLARQAWRGLGQEPVALLNDEQRVPRWPSGILGTITHTQSWCAAAVARRGSVSALGADVEGALPLEPGLWKRVCRPEEELFLQQAQREGQAPELAGLLAKTIFSAKESIYKALYPDVRVFLDFQAMRIELADEQDGVRQWHAELMVRWGHLLPGTRFGPGRASLDATLIATSIVL